MVQTLSDNYRMVIEEVLRNKMIDSGEKNING